MKIRLIRNATLRIDYAGKKILIDPDLGAKHAREPLAGKEKNPTVGLPIPAEEVIDRIEMVLVSHLHQDHFDAAAQELLPKELPLYCQPEDAEKILSFGFGDVRPIDKEIAWEGITITRTAAQHGTGVWAERLAPVSGFMFKAEGEPTIYWTGDTIYYPPVKEVIEKVKPNIIVTHSGGAFIGDSEPIIMDAEQTIAVCNDAPDAKVVAVHMEALDHCPVTRGDLEAAAKEAGVDDRLVILEDGETISL